MDKTLKDYIERTCKRIEEERTKSSPIPNDQYLVYPEQQGEEDRPRNPYSPT